MLEQRFFYYVIDLLLCMKKLILIIISCWCIACSENIKPAITPEVHEFFPVKLFLQGQVHEIDSLKLPTRKYTSINKKSDSILISINEFDSIAKEFFYPDINDIAIKKFYKETSFADQSIPSVTFNYVTSDKGLPLQRMDVIVDPDPVLNDKVKSIYLEKRSFVNDTFIVKKLYWKTNKFFQIISSKQAVGHPATFSEVKVSWSATD